MWQKQETNETEIEIADEYTPREYRENTLSVKVNVCLGVYVCTQTFNLY